MPNELVMKNPFVGGRYAYIRVADTGIGISAARSIILFERYYRITESHLGSGVGLAFVKSSCSFGTRRYLCVHASG